MSVVLRVPNDIATAAGRVAQRAGVDPEQIMLNALRDRFSPIPRELQAEFEALEQASDEDFLALATREGL